MNIQQSRTSNRITFWTIIITAIAIIILLSIISTIYQTLTKQAQATRIAIPTLTAEAVEAIYQKGLAYINIGRWEEAKRELDSVFELHPNYKEVQAKIIEVEAKLAELKQTPVISPTQEVIVSPIQEDVIAYYPFESNADDESGNQNQTIVHGGAIYTTEGKHGGAYQFDGENDFISTQLHISRREYENLTMFAWVKPITAFNSWKAILSADDGGYDRGFGVRVDEYEIQVGDKGWRPGVVMDLGRWQHIGVVYENGHISFYKDGVQYEYEDEANFGPSEQPLLIGANLACGVCFFEGYIDEVLIFNRALSAEEVKNLYQSQQ